MAVEGAKGTVRVPDSLRHVNVAAVLLQTENMLQLASRGVFILEHPKHPWSKEPFKVSNLAMQSF